MELPGYQIGELLHEGPRSRVWHGLSETGAGVVIRTPVAGRPGPQEQARYQRAFELGRTADTLAVVRHLDLVRHRAALALVTEAFDGVSLEQALPPQGLDVEHLLRLSVQLAESLARLHACGVLHRDLRPGKVLVHPGSGATRFIELDRGMRLHREAERVRALDPLDGDLRYCAPEQIGRIDAPVDDRADLYSLGATLFHLASGVPPFDGADRSELAHALVAAEAPVLNGLRPDLPAQFARIVRRLLNKNASERYASAIGLARDLRRCLEEFQREGSVSDFALGEHDVSPLFRLPSRLYGRAEASAQLDQSVTDALAGRRTLVQVAGRSGVGKTRLVEELRPRTLRRNLRYCAGKFDQFHQDRPYLAFIQAQRQLLHGLLSEPDERLNSWRQRLQQALGEQAGLLTEDLPELKAILGPQPPVAAANPYEAALRWQGLVQRFLHVFCVDAPGLVMFIDDLQWADPASINLLTALGGADGLEHLLLILGYRSNELGPGHPAKAALEAWQTFGVPEQCIHLGPLARDDVRDLVADTLQVSREQAEAVGQHVHAVAAGNVFFAREFLLALRKADYFRFDQQTGRWTWDETTLIDQPVPRELVGLLNARMQELPAACLDLLDTASCIGSEFDLATLASVHQLAPVKIALQFAPAVRRGLVVPLDANHRLYVALGASQQQGESGPPAGLAEADLPAARYRFQHDAVRLSVHDHLAEDARRQRHYEIGQLLLDTLPEADCRERVVEVFEHLSYGLDRVTDPQQRRAYARLGLDAGRAALRGLAFTAAREMLGHTARLLGEQRWREDRGLALDIHTALAECAFAQERMDDFEREIALVTEHAQSPWERAHAYALLIRVRTVQRRYDEAVDVCVAVARTLGVRLPRRPNMVQVVNHAVRARRAQRGQTPLAFEAAPEMQCPELAAAVHLLAHSATAAYFAEPNLFPLTGAMASRLSMREGMCPDSPFTFAAWAIVLCGALEQIERGYQFGQLATRVGRRYGGGEQASTDFVVDVFIRHWKEPLHALAETLYQDWDRLRRAGDEERAVYCAGVILYLRFLSGVALDADQRFAPAMDYIAASNKPHIKHAFMAWVQLHVALRMPQLPAELSGDWFDTATQLEEFVRTDDTVQTAMSAVGIGIFDCLAGRYARAEQRFDLAARHESGILSLALVPGLSFFRALNAYRARASLPHQAGTLRRRARRELRRLRKWQSHAPHNMDHRVSLLEAEEHLLRGRRGEALLALHTAIEQAAANGALLYQALAEQRLGECLAEAGRSQQAVAARERARTLFDQWGAPALADALDQGPMGLLATPAPAVEAVASSGLEQMDLRTLLEGVRSISSEMDRQALLLSLIESVMQSAGADRCLLVLLDESRRATVEAEARVGAPSQRLGLALADYGELARPAVDLALRTGETVLIADTADNDILRTDPYSQQAGVRSLLASSIQLKQHTLGLIYLENHLAADAFGPARVEIADALCAQAGIALENARLYENLRNALRTQAKLTDANKRFVPTEFLAGLGCDSIVDVDLNEAAEQEMAVVFVDLRGFTRLSETLGSRRTIEMINHYLAHVQPAIAANEGFVGQYYGDGILALFPQCVEDAARAAVDMCRGLERYNSQPGDFPTLRFGIGIHFGPLILGTVGSVDHFQCGVVGDSVNLASRIEGLTKFFGATLLLSGATHARLPAAHDLRYRYLGRVQVPGRSEVIDVYDCLDAYPTQQSAALLTAAPMFEDAMAVYRENRFEEATRGFEACLVACPDDPVSLAALARARTRAQRAEPWDGIERPEK